MIANTVIAYHFTFGPVRPPLTEVHFIALLPGDAENPNYATVAPYITSTNAECNFKIYLERRLNTAAFIVPMLFCRILVEFAYSCSGENSCQKSRVPMCTFRLSGYQI